MQRDAKPQSKADATDVLAPEIAELSKRVKDAEARVAAFRSQSDLLIGQDNSELPRSFRLRPSCRACAPHAAPRKRRPRAFAPH